MKLKENYSLSKKIKRVFFENFSLSVLLLPYLIMNSVDDEIGYKLFLFSFIPILIIIDLFFEKINHIIKIFIYSSFFYFFYSYIIYTDSYYYLQGLPFRYFSLFFLSISFLIFYFFRNLKSKRFLNVVILVFTFLTLINIFIPSFTSRINNLNEGFEAKKIVFNSVIEDRYKPIILIVCDELGTSNEIFKITKSKRDFDFDSLLLSKNYIVKENFYSHTKSTKISMASMFNFNLQKNQYIREQENRTDKFRTTTKLKNLFKYNSLTDSLNNYNADSFSYGLLNFPRGSLVTEKVNHLWGALSFEPFIYFFKEDSFLSDFFYKSVLNFLDKKLSLENNFFFDLSRKNTLNDLKEIDFKKKSFYYFHYYAPHDPYSFFNEFEEDDKLSKFENYINYRRFVLKKLYQQLDNEKFQNARIIIVGDHGLRDTKNVDPLNSFGAFYGFKSIDVNEIKSPQDIGHLVLHYLK